MGKTGGGAQSKVSLPISVDRSIITCAMRTKLVEIMIIAKIFVDIYENT